MSESKTPRLPQTQNEDNRLADIDTKGNYFVVYGDEEMVTTCTTFLTFSVSTVDFRDLVDGLERMQKYNRTDFIIDSDQYTFELSTEFSNGTPDHLHISMEDGAGSLEFTLMATQFPTFVKALKEARDKLDEKAKVATGAPATTKA